MSSITPCFDTWQEMVKKDEKDLKPGDSTCEERKREGGRELGRREAPAMTAHDTTTDLRPSTVYHNMQSIFYHELQLCMQQTRLAKKNVHKLRCMYDSVAYPCGNKLRVDSTLT
jgi:hypothetical protein